MTVWTITMKMISGISIDNHDDDDSNDDDDDDDDSPRYRRFTIIRRLEMIEFDIL